MLVLTTERLALLALDPPMAALQAGDTGAFFDAIAVTPEPEWPPAPFEPHALAWAADHLKHGSGRAGLVRLDHHRQGRTRRFTRVGDRCLDRAPR